MWLSKFVSFIAILPLTVGLIESPEPRCATRCWDNTKYVTKCLFNEDACLCSDTGYQKSLYQCIYSQCDTFHFHPALQHVLSRCPTTGNEILFASAPTPNRDELRRREEEYVTGERIHGSGSAIGYLIGSANQYPTDSAKLPTESAGWPIQSAGYATKSGGNSYVTASPSPNYLARDVKTPLPTVTTAVPTALFEMMSPVPIEEVHGVHASEGSRMRYSFAVPVAITFGTLYLAL